MDYKTTSKGTKLPISNIKGKAYLEVKWRIVWMRDEHPDWTIETKIISHDKEHSVVQAIIKNNDLLISMAHKQEDGKGFVDHLEKAETGAIGRALALCGFGTQFDGTEIDEGSRLADSPVELPKQTTNVVNLETKEGVISSINKIIHDRTNKFEDQDKLKELKDIIGISSSSDLKLFTIDKLKQVLAKLG
jgi:hypothetical protein